MKPQIFFAAIIFTIIYFSHSLSAQQVYTSTENYKISGIETSEDNSDLLFSPEIDGSRAYTIGIAQNPVYTCAGLCNGTLTIVLTSGAPTYPVILKLFGGGPPACTLAAPCTTITLTGVGPSVFPLTIPDVCGSTNSYTIRANDNNGAGSNVNITGIAVVGSTFFEISSDLVISPDCAGDTNGVINIIQVDYATYPVYFAWNRYSSDTGTVESGDTIKLLHVGPGSYTVTVTDANGCNQPTFNYIVTQPDSIFANATIVNVLCNGANNGSITLNLTGGTPPFTFTWADIGTPGAQSTRLGLSPGNYCVHITDGNNCSKDTCITITQPGFAFSISIFSFTNPTCPTLTNGTITATGTGGTRPYHFTWNTVPAQTDSTAIGLLPGCYTVSAVDDNGCTAPTSPQQCLVPPGLPTATAGNTGPYCEGQTIQLTSDITPLPATDYTYSWSGPVAFVAGSQNPTRPGATLAYSGTYYVTITHISTGCWDSSLTVVTVNPLSVGGTASAAPNPICTGSNTTLTLAGYTGTIQWQSSPDNVTFTNIVGATTTPYTTTGGIATTIYYRAVVTSGACTGANSTTVTVTVSPLSVGGTASAVPNPVCTGSNTTLTLAGFTGTIQWQSSTDNITFTNIAGATTTPYTTTGGITATTYYRAVVTSGVCTSTNSTTVTVTVSPLSVGGTASAAPNPVCTGSNTTLTLAGFTGTIQWQSSTDNITFTNIAGATTTPYTTTGGITATTYYRAVVTSGVCTSANSTTVTVTVSPLSIGGTASATPNPVCSGSNTILTLAGYTGTIQWQSSTDNITFTNIAGATTTPYTTTGGITATTYYRAVVTSGVCTSANSTTVTVTVSPLSVGGTASATPNPVCTGSNTTLTLAGYTGTIQWQSSTDNITFTNIAGATTTPYTTTGGITATTYYRAVVISGVCASANSTTVTVTVNPLSVGGTASAAPNPVCTGSNTTLTLAGYTGTIQWQSSTDNITFTNIAGATTTPYTTTGGITATKYFRAVVTSGVCASANSTTVTVTVNPLSVGGTAAAAPNPVCTGSNTTLTLAGYTGTIQWQSSTDNITFTNIAGATATPYTTTGGITATTYYKAVVTSGVCASANSTTVTITVNPLSVGGTASAAPNPVCTGSNTTLTLAGYTGTIQWQSSTDNITFTNIAGATATPYTTTGGITATKYFRAVVTSGACASANSTTVTVTVNPLSVGGTTSAVPNPVCPGSNTTLTLAGYTGTIQWQSSPDNITFTNIAGATATPYTTTGGIIATTYYRAVVTSGVCASANSTTVTVTVSPLSVGGTASAAPNPICSGSNTTLTLAGYIGTIQWQSSTDNITFTNIVGATTTPYTTTGGITVTTYYRAVVSNGACSSANSTTVTVTVNPSPTITNVTPGSRCGCGTVTLGATASAGTINWYATAFSFPILGTGTSFTTPVICSTVNYYVDATAGGCPSTSRTPVTAIIYTVPTVTASNNSPVCIGGTLNLTSSVAPNGNYSYSWSGPVVPSPFDSTLQNPSITPVAPNAAGTYTVLITDTITTCANSATTIVVLPPQLTVNITDSLMSCGTLPEVIAGMTYLPDGLGVPYTTSILHDAFAPGQIINNATDIEVVCASMEHSWTGDLQIKLICPNGQSTMLKSGGSGGSNTLGEPIMYSHPDWGSDSIPQPGVGYTYCWDANASNSMAAAPLTNHDYTDLRGYNHPNTPYLSAGSYLPSQSFGNLVGCPLNGNWTIEVYDQASGDNGYIFWWRLGFNPLLTSDFCTGSATASITGGTNPISFQWNNGDTSSLTISSLCPGDYWIVTTDDNGCTATDSVTVIDVDLSLNTSHVDLLCNDVPTGSATAIPSGGSGYSYQWQHAGWTADSTNASILNLFAGDYYITVTDTSWGCQKNDTVTLTQPNPISIAWSKTDVACNGASIGSFILTASGGISPYTYDITGQTQNSAGTVTFSSLSAGVYTITVTDASGCVNNDTIITIIDPAQIIINPDPPLVTTPITCNGGTGTITVIATGGSGPLTYTILGTLISNPIGTFNTLCGTYQFIASDANGCADTSLATTMICPLPVTVDHSEINVSPCFNSNNGSITLTASGGTAPYTYGVAGQTSQNSAGTVTFPALAINCYNITVSDANGCSATIVPNPICITGPAAITATAALYHNIKCHGECNDSIVITAAGGTGQLSYSIDGATSWQAGNGHFTNLCAGVYTLKVKDASGCTADPVPSTITITEPDSLIITNIAFTAMTCVSTTTTITVTAAGGTGTYNFQLNGSFWNQTGIFPNESAGSDTLHILDFNFCPADSIFNITAPVGFTLDSGITNITCNGFNDGSITVTVTGGASPYDYIWAPGSSTLNSPLLTNTVNGLSAGLYSCTVIDNNSCRDSILATVIEPNALSSSIAVLDAHCSASDGEATITPTGGTGALTIAWVTSSSAATITGLAFGQYTVTVTDINNCFIEDTAIINNIDAPVLTFTDIINNKCYGYNIGSATVVITGGTPPYNTITWDEGTNGVTIIDLYAGNYWVTVTDFANCSTQADTNIIEGPEITFTSFTTTDVSCFGLTDGSLNSVATGGSGTLDYDIGGGPYPTGVFIDLVDGDYWLIITDSLDCFTQRPFTINPPTQIVIQSENSSNVNCYGNINGTITVTADGGSGNLMYVLYQNALPIDTNLITGFFAPLPADTFYVRVIDVNNPNCWVNSNNLIIIQPNSITTAIVQVNPDCGVTNGSITLTPSGGTPGYTYAWSIPGILNSQSNLGVGTYTCTVTDLNSCSDSSISVTLINPSAGTLIFIPLDTIRCYGDTTGKFYYFISGGQAPFTPAWSVSASNISGDSLINLGAGTYSLTLTDALGCIIIKDTTLANPDSIHISNITATNITCNGDGNGTVTIIATGGTGELTYSLDIPLLSNTTGIFTPLSGGNYNITVTDIFSCNKFAAQQTIIEPTSMSFVISTDTAHCNLPDGGAQIDPSGGTPGYNYDWFDHLHENSPLVLGLAFGIYHVEVTDANNCKDTATVQILENAPGALSFINISSNKCFGDTSGRVTATLTGAPFPVTYLWDLPSTDSTIINLAAGFYIVTTTDGTSCHKTDTVEITVPTQIILAHTDTNLLCFSIANGSITGVASGGAGGYWYYLGADSNQTGYFPNLIANTTYTLSVKDTNNCQVDSSITLTQPPTLTFIVAVSYPDCGVQNGDICLTVIGGTQPYNYQWQQIGWLADSTRNCILNLASGTYTVTVTDQNGCTKDTIINLINPQAGGISFNPVTNLTCFGVCEGSATVVMTGGNPPFQYAWSSHAWETTSTADSLCAQTYYVTVTDIIGCISIDTLQITQPDSISVSTSIITPILCYGNTGVISVTASGGTNTFSYFINPTGSGYVINNTFTGLLANSYTITVRDSNHCSQTAPPVVLTQPDDLILSSIFTDIRCQGEGNAEIIVTASGGIPAYHYLLNTNSSSDLIGTYTGLLENTYTVLVTDSNGCTKIAGPFNVTDPPLLSLTTSVVMPNCLVIDGSATVTASGGVSPYTYQWDLGPAFATYAPIGSGNYFVDVTDARNCTHTTSASLTDIGACNVVFSGVSSVQCFSDTNGTATAALEAGCVTIPASYQWTDGDTNPTATHLPGGLNGVTITDAMGCQSAATVNIITPDSFNVHITTTDILCHGANTGNISFLVTGGTAPYQFSLTGGAPWSSSSSFTALAAGTYQLAVRDTNLCTKIISIVTLVEPDAITFSSPDITNVVCHGGSNGMISLTASGGVEPYVYIIQPNGFPEYGSGVFPTLTAGSYVITAKDLNGCTNSTAQINVTEPDIIAVTVNTSDATCGLCDGTASVSAIGGTPGYTYLWDATAGGGSNPDAVNLCGGSYPVTVTDSRFCSSVSFALISSMTNATVTYADTNVRCTGGNDGNITILNVTGGTPPLTINWSNGDSGIEADTLSAGIYFATITDVLGCIKMMSDTIIEPDLITLALTNSSDASCFGDSTGTMTILASGGTPGYQYSLDNQINWYSNGNITGLAAADYIVIVRDTNQCIRSFPSVSIGQPSQMHVTTTIDSSACGLNNGVAYAWVSGGSTTYNYNWNPGNQSDYYAYDLAPGQYTVIVTDSKGCIDSAQASISDTGPGSIVFNPVTNINCFGDSTGSATATLFGAIAVSYEWPDISPYPYIGQTVSNLPAGSYIVEVLTSIGCLKTNTVTLDQTEMLQASAAIITDANCYLSNDGTIEAILSGGTAPYSYIIGSDTSVTSDTLLADTLLAGSYVITVTDNNGCFYTIDTIIVGQPTAISISSNVLTNPTCTVADGTTTVTVTGGTPNYTYLWCNGQTNDTAINMTAGTCWIIITDTHSCIDSLMVLISNMNAPVIDLNPVINNNCYSDSLGSITANVTGGTPFVHGYNYLWNNIPPSDSSVVNNLPAGYYFISVTDSLGCIALDSITITQPYELILSLIDTASISCYGNNNGLIQVSATGGTPGYSFSSNGVLFQTSPLFNSLAGGTYTITVKDTVGCIKTINNLIISEPDSIHIVLTKTDPTCSSGTHDGSVSSNVIGGSPTYTYHWSNDAFTSAINNLSGGKYFITVTDQRLCTKIDSASILGTVEVYANAGSDTSVCQGTKIQMNGSGGDSYKWIPPLYLSSDIVQYPIATAEETITYYIVATIGLCSDTDTVIVNVKHIDPVDAGADVSMLVGETTTLTATCEEVNPIYQWTPLTGLSNSTILTPTVDIQTTTYYYITATSTNGCYSTDSVKVTVIPRIQFAEGLSPNGDGINDTWVIRYHEYYTDINVSVYNRWGELLFYNKGCTEYWDGRYKGKELPVGTYYYVITVEEIRGKVVLTGPISIIK